MNMKNLQPNKMIVLRKLTYDKQRMANATHTQFTETARKGEQQWLIQKNPK